jgi:hypothetical protein
VTCQWPSLAWVATARTRCMLSCVLSAQNKRRTSSLRKRPRVWRQRNRRVAAEAAGGLSERQIRQIRDSLSTPLQCREARLPQGQHAVLLTWKCERERNRQRWPRDFRVLLCCPHALCSDTRLCHQSDADLLYSCSIGKRTQPSLSHHSHNCAHMPLILSKTCSLLCWKCAAPISQ